MAFFKAQSGGRLYVIRMVLPDETVVHKIGMTNQARSTDRFMAILRSWFVNYRFVPYSELRLDMECSNAATLEKFIHGILEKRRYDPNFPVEGHTEMFVDLDEGRLINFLKSWENGNYPNPPKLTKSEQEIMCGLIAP